MANIVEINGELMTAEQAQVPVTDMGVLYGIGLFETMRAYQGEIFRLPEHLNRLLDSATKLNMPFTAEMLPDETRFTKLLSENNLTDARVRLTVTGGSPVAEGIKHSVVSTAVKIEPYPQEYYERGITVLVSPLTQLSNDPLAGHKTTCYWPRLQLLLDAQAKGCAEALWFNEDNLLTEGSISNVFIVEDGTVKTPSPEAPVLPGITRAAVLELCSREGIKHEETALTIDNLLDADEVFITNCMMEIVPVVRVERKPISSQKVGMLTRSLMEGYKKLVNDKPNC